jgi:aryl-alcohol dehydrogenase-like predicted oxidoreductase
MILPATYPEENRMRYRTLGRTSGLRVSELALGTGKFGRAVPPDVAERVLAEYADVGGWFIDTAAGYQGGESERIIGRFVGARRDDFVIGTKWAVGVTREEPFTVRGTNRKAMIKSVEDSLRRLGSDYIDILWTHGYDDKVPIEEIMLGFDRLVSDGKIRYGGLGSHPAWKVARAATIAELRGWAPMAGISIEYGASERDAERELVPAAEAMGFGVVAWSPLGGGFLARPESPEQDGQLRSPSSHLPHWTDAGRPDARDRAVHRAVRDVATELGAAPAAVGYAWLLARARRSTTSIIPVVAASTVQQLRDNLRALTLDLSPDQIRRIDEVGTPALGEPHIHNLLSDPMQEAGDFYRHAIPVA